MNNINDLATKTKYNVTNSEDNSSVVKEDITSNKDGYTLKGSNDIIDKRDYRIIKERIDGINGIVSVTPKKVINDNRLENTWSFHIEISWDNPHEVKARKESVTIEAFNIIYRSIQNRNPFGSKFLPEYLSSYILLQGCSKSTGLLNLGNEKNSNRINKCYRIISINREKEIWRILAPNGIILDWKRGQGATLLKGVIKIQDDTTDILYFLLNNWKEINVEYGLIEDIEIEDKTFSIVFIRKNARIRKPIYECYGILEDIIKKQQECEDKICYDTITLITERPNGDIYYYDLRVDKLYKPALEILNKLNLIDKP